MRDELVRAITADGLVKAVAVTGRDLVERARGIHTLLPMATAALGRTLLAMYRIPMWNCGRRPPASWMWAGLLARRGASLSSRTWG